MKRKEFKRVVEYDDEPISGSFYNLIMYFIIVLLCCCLIEMGITESVNWLLVVGGFLLALPLKPIIDTFVAIIQSREVKFVEIK